MDEWEKLQYQNSISDIRWAKEQSWKAIQWIILLFAAISGLALKLKNEKVLIEILSIFVAGIACYYLIDLYNFARKTRNGIAKYKEHSKGIDEHH